MNCGRYQDKNARLSGKNTRQDHNRVFFVYLNNYKGRLTKTNTDGIPKGEDLYLLG